jgi:hypothetical protein
VVQSPNISMMGQLNSAIALHGLDSRDGLDTGRKCIKCWGSGPCVECNWFSVKQVACINGFVFSRPRLCQCLSFNNLLPKYKNYKTIKDAKHLPSIIT